MPIVSGNSSPIVITGLTANTTYNFVVKSINGVGKSAGSTSVSVTPNPTLAIDYLVVAGGGGGGGSVAEIGRAHV